jgi:hypothetical protein
LTFPFPSPAISEDTLNNLCPSFVFTVLHIQAHMWWGGRAEGAWEAPTKFLSICLTATFTYTLRGNRKWSTCKWVHLLVLTTLSVQRMPLWPITEALLFDFQTFRAHSRRFPNA